jgi:hypothetical protein
LIDEIVALKNSSIKNRQKPVFYDQESAWQQLLIKPL